MQTLFIRDVILAALGNPGQIVCVLLSDLSCERYQLMTEDNVVKRIVVKPVKLWSSNIGFSEVTFYHHINKLELQQLVSRRQVQGQGGRCIGLWLNEDMLAKRVNAWCLQEGHQPSDLQGEMTYDEALIKRAFNAWHSDLFDLMTTPNAPEIPVPSATRPPVYVRGKTKVNPFEDPYSPWELLSDLRVRHKPSQRLVDHRVVTKLLRNPSLLQQSYAKNPLEVELAVTCLGENLLQVMQACLRHLSTIQRLLFLEPQEQLDLMFISKNSDISLQIDWADTTNLVAHKRFKNWWLHQANLIQRIHLLDELLSCKERLLTMQQVLDLVPHVRT